MPVFVWQFGQRAWETRMAHHQHGLQLALDATEARLRRKAETEPARLAEADEALQKGDIDRASLLYERLALSKPVNQITRVAQQRIRQLQDETRQKWDSLDARLAGRSTGSSASTLPSAVRRVTSDSVITEVFAQFDQLIRDYGSIPGVGEDLRQHVSRLRSRPDYAAVLYEPEALHLWQLAQQYEQDDQLCCAYHVYEQMQELNPAPSAKRAKLRLTQLQRHPDVIAGAEACRQLQWCHETYRRAEMLLAVRPEQAKAYFRQIVEKAPADSEVYLASAEKIRSLP